MYPLCKDWRDCLFTPKDYREMSATKPALLRAFAESFASPYHNANQKSGPGEKKVLKSTRKLRRKVNQMKVKAGPPKVKAPFSSSFRYVVQPTCLKAPLCLYLNAKFCKENRLENNTLVDLTIHGVIENRWAVEFVYRDHSDFKRKAIMHNGFQEFIEDNDLKEGDQLVFHLMPCTLGNTSRPWFQVFIKSQNFCPSSNHVVDEVGDEVLFPKVCKVLNRQMSPSPSRIVVRSPEGQMTQETRPPIQRSYKLVFNGRVVRHFSTLEYSN